MKVSIITVTYNSAKTLERTIRSVQEQTYQEIEHIIVDGASTDGTLDIIRANEKGIARYVSEPDEGIYDAINKGLKMATGSIIGLLNSDDVLANEFVIEQIVRTMRREKADIVYGDLVYVDREDDDKIVRYWRSNKFKRRQLYFGWMPPHPTLYVRRQIYEDNGLYSTALRISADYDFMLRILRHDKYKKAYIPQVLVRMAMGGISNRNLRTIMLKTREDYRVLRFNNVGGLFTLLCKNVRKIVQFLR